MLALAEVAIDIRTDQEVRRTAIVELGRFAGDVRVSLVHAAGLAGGEYEADIVIAHNSRRFDIPNLQTRFLLHKLSPPKPYRQIDTLLIVRKEFGFTHNNLNAIAEVLGLGEKIDTTIELWKKCRGGDTKALDEMETYNVQDVLLLEEVYLALLPWIKAHPNVGLYLDTDVSVCSSCGSSKLKKYGLYITNASKFQAYKCKKCKSISRSRINCHDKDLKKNLLVPISR